MFYHLHLSYLSHQYADLQERFGQSGAGGIDRIRDEMTHLEWVALDYLGIVAIDGKYCKGILEKKHKQRGI